MFLNKKTMKSTEICSDKISVFKNIRHYRYVHRRILSVCIFRRVLGRVEQRYMNVPTELVPTCPVCGAPMVTNLRCDSTFVQDEGWYEAKSQNEAFISRITILASAGLLIKAVQTIDSL